MKLSLLRNTAALRGEPGLDSGMTAQLLHGLASDLVQIRVDLTQYPETYYYRDQSPDAALPAVLGHAVGLGETAQRSGSAEVRLAGDMLSHSLADFCHLLRREFGTRGSTTDEVLAHYASDHGHERGA